MPANLPPQYFEKEKELKKAKTPQERVAILEELLAIVPKHKGTEKLQALLKTKIAKLRVQGHKSPAGARHTATFQVEKTGAGQVIFIGSPNAKIIEHHIRPVVFKSTLLGFFADNA